MKKFTLDVATNILIIIIVFAIKNIFRSSDENTLYKLLDGEIIMLILFLSILKAGFDFVVNYKKKD